MMISLRDTVPQSRRHPPPPLLLRGTNSSKTDLPANALRRRKCVCVSLRRRTRDGGRARARPSPRPPSMRILRETAGCGFCSPCTNRKVSTVHVGYVVGWFLRNGDDKSVREEEGSSQPLVADRRPSVLDATTAGRTRIDLPRSDDNDDETTKTRRRHVRTHVPGGGLLLLLEVMSRLSRPFPSPSRSRRRRRRVSDRVFLGCRVDIGVSVDARCEA